MALRVATITGLAMAGTVSRAHAEPEPTGASDPGPSERSDGKAVGPEEALKLAAPGRFSCMSRGPAAPPPAVVDHATLLEELA